jgi:UDP-glucose 4-epimerase
VRGDIRNGRLVEQILAEYRVSAVLHFAGLKAVGESIHHSLDYYENNVAGTVTLCQSMEAAGVYRLVFSSSATVYGDFARMPLHEDLPTGNPTILTVAPSYSSKRYSAISPSRMRAGR